MPEAEPTKHNPNDLAIWRTALPNVQSASLPPSSDRPKVTLQDGGVFGSIFSPAAAFALDAADGAVCWRRDLPSVGCTRLKPPTH
jgi:hypothetical protein